MTSRNREGGTQRGEGDLKEGQAYRSDALTGCVQLGLDCVVSAIAPVSSEEIERCGSIRYYFFFRFKRRRVFLSLRRVFYDRVSQEINPD